MKRFSLILLLSVVLLMSQSCVQKQSALDKLRTNNKDTLESLRFPENDLSQIRSHQNNPNQGNFSNRSNDELDVIDLSPINSLKATASKKYVTITGNNVPLRKGPGGEYKKIRLANKQDSFELLREAEAYPGAPIWYWVQDEAQNKYYVSSLASTVYEKSGQGNTNSSVIAVPKETPSARFHTKIFKNPPPLPKDLVRAKQISLNFEGTKLYDVITTFCELLNLNYLIEGKIEEKITLQTFNKIPARDLYSVFEQILSIHNIAVVQSGKFYRFLPTTNAIKTPLDIRYGEEGSLPKGDRLIIQIIPIKHVPINSMRKVLTPLLSQKAMLNTVPDTQNFLLIDYASNVDKIMNIIKALDVNKLASSDIQLYKIQNSDATLVVEELVEIFTSIGYKSALDESLTFLPISRLNSILVVNSLESAKPTIRFWIEKLDQPTSDSNLSTFVYYVQNAEADKLAPILSSIFAKDEKKDKNKDKRKTKNKKKNKKQKKSRRNTRTGSPKTDSLRVKGGIQSIDGELTIIPDPDSNSLVIRTDPRNYPAVLEIIKKLDLMPQQVLIEVLIMDLTIDDETKTGLEWALKGSADGNIMAGGTAGAAATLGSQIGEAATPLFAPGASFFINKPDRLIALLQAFASDSKVNVLANPILVTSDNKEASISVTDDIPIQSSTLTTNTTQPVTNTTVEYRSVGIKLGILPKINSDNFVNLKIAQEISDLGTFFQNTPSFTTRVVDTEVVLKDNQILVMGGLMRTTTTETHNGVPVLKDIPYLGRLFGTNDNQIKKTELMIFIIPHIISDVNDSRYVTDQFKNRLNSLKKAVAQPEG